MFNVVACCCCCCCVCVRGVRVPKLLGFARVCELGRHARRLLEEGRLRYLREHGGFDAVHLVRYCAGTITSDNLCIIATKSMGSSRDSAAHLAAAGSNDQQTKGGGGRGRGTGSSEDPMRGRRVSKKASALDGVGDAGDSEVRCQPCIATKVI